MQVSKGKSRHACMRCTPSVSKYKSFYRLQQVTTYEAEYVYSYIRSSPFEMCKKTYIECSALMCRVNSYKTKKFDYYNALSLAG